MTGGAYIDPYPRDKTLTNHKENIAVICDPSATCFGEPLEDFLNNVCSQITDYGNTIDTADNYNAIELVERSCPTGSSTPDEQRDAEKSLITHSLWVIRYETLLRDDLYTALCYQVRGLPDETAVFSWVDSEGDRESIETEISSQFTSVQVATSKSELEDNIKGYLGFQVNPNGAEQNVIAWSHNAANKIDKID
ncbi:MULTISPECIES: hypothetical protein [Halorussus]|uniref:hypothetical protein n=1 Tax=Halorussus TaxID=1070314 RepID=UPI0013B3B4F1|nr:MULTISPECIES: hypothetical protein [Halorussus]NHN59801.1 hypothetical protein [Halorussus sp. JP-T4]